MSKVQIRYCYYFTTTTTAVIILVRAGTVACRSARFRGVAACGVSLTGGPPEPLACGQHHLVRLLSSITSRGHEHARAGDS